MVDQGDWLYNRGRPPTPFSECIRMRSLFLFLSLLLLLACTSLPPATPTPQPTPASLPVDALVTPLRFTRSGGIAGVQDQARSGR